MTTTLGAPRPTTAGAGNDPFSHFAAAVRRELPVDEVVLLTTMPRGGLQVCHGPTGYEVASRRYSTDTHTHDAPAWRALIDGVSTNDGAADAIFSPEFDSVLNVRVDSPVFGGYPGVVRLLRRSDAAASAISKDEAAGQVRELFARDAKPRPAGAARQFVFVGDRLLLPKDASGPLADAARAHAVAAMGRSGVPAAAGRETVPGDDGVRVPVQVVRFDEYPALGSGPVVFVSLHPEVADWSLLRPEDFAADPELARLTTAVAFMVEHFRRSPTLGDVADAVHLSQFHFHRRFSELFGLTPKHLLYDLQLDEAQRMLADPRQQLASIAKHCGFAHQSHFTSRFKQGTGLTPTRWRRRAVTDTAPHAAVG